LEPGLDPADFPTTAALNAAVAATAERQIREHIDQWCIFRPLWEGTPAREGELAGSARGVEA
jgi:lauroyl/myristoyl acyltransferase